jgi:dTDP-4-dehydrorhamnose reductase
MKIILIGVYGQVGSEVQDLAKTLQLPLVSFGHNLLDITNLEQINTALLVHQDATVLINAAAYTAVDLAEDEPELAYAVNAIGPKNLATWCNHYQVPMIHISTDYVFLGDAIIPYCEDDATDPATVYGKTKLAGEKFVQSICKEHLILRVSWVFGRYGKNFVKTMIRLAQEREVLKIVNDQIGNPTPASDIARVLLLLASKIDSKELIPWGVYHYCGKGCLTWYEFACAIVEEARQCCDLKVRQILPIATHEFPTKAARPQYSVLNCDRITEQLKVPQQSWRECLHALVKTVVK